MNLLWNYQTIFKKTESILKSWDRRVKDDWLIWQPQFHHIIISMYIKRYFLKIRVRAKKFSNYFKYSGMFGGICGYRALFTPNSVIKFVSYKSRAWLITMLFDICHSDDELIWWIKNIQNLVDIVRFIYFYW